MHIGAETACPKLAIFFLQKLGQNYFLQDICVEDLVQGAKFQEVLPSSNHSKF
jgi:hypothetical protein